MPAVAHEGRRTLIRLCEADVSGALPALHYSFGNHACITDGI